MTIFRCNRGASVVEFALVIVPVFIFILGIIQTGYIVWAYNLLQTSVNTAARCGALGSTTPPCAGANMTAAASTIFAPLSATFNPNTTSCPAGNVGLIGTYNITMFVMIVSLTVTAKSCYPTIPAPA